MTFSHITTNIKKRKFQRRNKQKRFYCVKPGVTGGCVGAAVVSGAIVGAVGQAVASGAEREMILHE